MPSFLFLKRIFHWCARVEQRQRLGYLAGASDLAELERRMRALERSG
jgi:hypothetical protein